MIKKISFWAARHRLLAQLLIILSFGILISCAIVLGTLSHINGIELSPSLSIGSAILFLGIFLLYPKKDINNKWSKSYAYRKTIDTTLPFLTFLMICFGVNQWLNFSDTETSTLSKKQLKQAEFKNPQATFIVNIIQPEAEELPVFSKEWLKKNKKEFKRSIRSKVKTFKKALKQNKSKKTSVFWQVVLILLSIFLGLIALLIIGLIACGVGCNGSPGLATAIMIVGLLGIVAGLYFVIRKIVRGKSKLAASV